MLSIDSINIVRKIKVNFEKHRNGIRKVVQKYLYFRYRQIDYLSINHYRLSKYIVIIFKEKNEKTVFFRPVESD